MKPTKPGRFAKLIWEDIKKTNKTTSTIIRFFSRGEDKEINTEKNICDYCQKTIDQENYWRVTHEMSGMKEGINIVPLLYCNADCAAQGCQYYADLTNPSNPTL